MGSEVVGHSSLAGIETGSERRISRDFFPPPPYPFPKEVKFSHHPGRSREQEENDHPPVNDVPVMVPLLDELGHPDQKQGPHGWTEEFPSASHDYHEKHQDRIFPGEGGLIDIPHQMSEKASGQTRDRGGNHENEEFVAVNRVPHEMGGQFRLPDTSNDLPPTRPVKIPHQVEGQEEESEDDVIIVVHVESEGTDPGHGNIANPLRRPRQIGHQDDRFVDDDVQRNGRHREIDPGQTKGGDPQEKPDQSRGQDCGRQRQPVGEPELQTQQGRGIGADSKEARMSQRNQSGVPH